MAAYYVNTYAQPNGDHEVHVAGCELLPEPEQRVELGEHESCFGALRVAQARGYLTANGCKHCALACHRDGTG